MYNRCHHQYLINSKYQKLSEKFQRKRNFDGEKKPARLSEEEKKYEISSQNDRSVAEGTEPKPKKKKLITDCYNAGWLGSSVSV